MESCSVWGVSAICPPLHSTHGRKLTTITHLFNQIYIYIYIYIYINFGLVLFLSSPLPKEKNKHTNKKFLEKKNNGTTNPPPPFTSFWSLILFYSFINHDLVNLLQTLFTIFYFISVLVMSSLLCSKVNMCSRAFICLVFLVMGSHP